MGFSGRAQMPRVSYATALDSFVIICFSFVFAVMIEYAAINCLDKMATDLKKMLQERNTKKVTQRTLNLQFLVPPYELLFLCSLSSFLPSCFFTFIFISCFLSFIYSRRFLNFSLVSIPSFCLLSFLPFFPPPFLIQLLRICLKMFSQV
jgi:hypothetical protein